MQTPKISVALITYNHAKYIAQALDSIFAQQLDEAWELVVGDDASTDGTYEIIQEHLSRHPATVQWLERGTNLGMHRNGLRTMAACRGKYVAILEGDDFWTAPHKLRTQTAYLDTHDECAACFHPVNVVDDQGRPLNEVHPGQRPPFLQLQDLLRSNDIPTCSMMFRRALLPEMPASIQTLAMTDWPLYIQLARRGPVGCIDEVMACYRRHNSGTWTSHDEGSRMDRIRTMHDWLLSEGLSGDERATWSAMAMWEARRALYEARQGRKMPALRHVVRHLRAACRGRVAPDVNAMIKTALAAAAFRPQI